MRRAFRIATKGLAWLAGSLAVLLAAWFAANRLLDEAPAPGRDALLVRAEDRIPDEHNAAAGIQRLKDLSFSVTSDQVTCWLDPDHPVFENLKGCLPFEEAPRILRENREALDRYRSLFRLERYSSLDISHNPAMFVFLRLTAAQIHLALRARQHEAAYRAWSEQMAFVRRNLRGTDTWVGKAVGMVSFGLTFELLQNLLQADPGIARRADLLALLQPGGIEAFNPDGIVRAEYAVFRKALIEPPGPSEFRWYDRLHWLAIHLGQHDRIHNRYYAFAQDYTAMLWLPWNDVKAQLVRLAEKHIAASTYDVLVDPFGTLFVAIQLDGYLKTPVMVRQMHVVDGKLRLATLLVRILDEGVPDRDIPAFLASAGPALHDPFSGQPAQWDAKERRIQFPDREHPGLMYASLRVPAR